MADYTTRCAVGATTPAVANGAMLTLMQGVASGGFTAMNALPMQLAMNSTFVWTYLVLQCPLEAIQGRQSLWHNVFAGGTLGYLGAATNRVGLFGMEYTFLANRIPLAVGGALVYGTMGGVLGALGGKRP